MKWFRALLRKLRPSKVVTFTPKSDWPELLVPHVYQNKLMRQYEEQNEKNIQTMLDRIGKGAKLVGQSTVAGPYTTHMNYRLDDGSDYNVIWRSSLHWVDPLFPS